MAVYIKAFYDWVEQTEALSDAERGRLFVAMLEYARTREVPQLEGNERILFPVFKAQIDRDECTATSRSQSGAKGGKQKKETEAKESKPKQNEILQANLPNKEEEKEEEKEKEYKKESVKEKDKGADALEADAKGTASATTSLLSMISDYSFSNALQQRVEDWVQYKAERKEAYREQGFRALLRQIESNASKYGEQAVCELIEQSMASGWKGIIFDRLKEPRREEPQKRRINWEDKYDNGPQFPWEVFELGD